MKNDHKIVEETPKTIRIHRPESSIKKMIKRGKKSKHKKLAQSQMKPVIVNVFKVPDQSTVINDHSRGIKSSDIYTSSLIKESKSGTMNPSAQSSTKPDEKLRTTELLKAAASQMITINSKATKLRESEDNTDLNFGHVIQDDETNKISSSTPQNSSLTVSTCLEISAVTTEDNISNLLSNAECNTTHSTNVTQDVSTNNNSQSLEESEPPSGFSEILKDLRPDWPGEYSDNTGVEVDNTENSLRDNEDERGTNNNMKTNNNNSIDCRIGDIEVDVPGDLIDSCSENTNEESNNNQDSTYNPSTILNETSVEEPVVEKTVHKRSPLLKKSSLDIRKLKVPVASGKKAKTKKHFCPYCKTLQSKFSRHLMLKHKKEDNVRKFIFLPKRHSQRLKIIDMIRKEGDFMHNTDEKLNSGILILPRRRQKSSINNSEDYTCCKLCKGFFPKQTIRFHVSNCQTDRNKVARDVLITGRRVTGYIHASANDTLRNEVFPILRDDDVSRSVRYDDLLIKFANKLTEKYTLKHQHDMIRAQLRLLGRLKLEIMLNNGQITEFKDIFKPENYDVVIKSLRVIANWDISTMSFKTPAVAQNLMTLIIKCCKKFRAECIKIQDEDSKKSAEDFLLLWQEEVPVLINKKAQEDQINKKRLKKIILPSKEDIKLLYDYLNKESNTCLAILKDKFDFNAWKLLTESTLISIQIFNRRRAGEIERLKIENYSSKQDLTEHIDKDLYNKLSDTTRKFAKQFVRLTIRGKLGRSVPVLLNPLAVECINVILAFREKANVCPDNEFIFSVPGSNSVSKKYLRACPLMRRFANDCGASLPSSLRGTTLRKHIATYTSLLNVEDCQVTKLANFMGHAKEIHKSFYQVPVPISEITEVSKMLMAALGNDDDNDDDVNKDESENDESEKEDSDSDENDDSHTPTVESGNANVNSNHSSNDDDSSNNSSVSDKSEPSRRKTLKNRKIVRRRWSVEEKKILTKHFGKLSKLPTLPSLKDCASLIKKYSQLGDRTPAQIKSFIHNQRGRIN